MIVEDPTPEQAALFRMFSLHDDFDEVEAAHLALGFPPRSEQKLKPMAQSAVKALEDAIHERFTDEYMAAGCMVCVPREKLREWFAERGFRPAFLYPESWKKSGGKPTEDAPQPQPEPDATTDLERDFERMPRLLREAIRAWHDFYASGEEPPKKAELIEELLSLGYAQTKTEAEAIDKIIRPDAIKRGVPYRKTQ